MGRGRLTALRDTPTATKKEAARCDVLSDRERVGEISDLEQQPKFWFAINGKPLAHKNGRRVGYTADFRYKDEQGRTVVEEVKGLLRLETGRYVERSSSPSTMI